MIYGPEHLRPIDPIASFRRRPSMYGGPYNEAKLAGALLHDAMQLGASRVLVEKHLDWHIVSADIDWLQVKGKYCHSFTPAQLFRQVVSFPEDGDNSMRREILITAFASEAISCNRDEKFVVSGNIPLDSPIWDQMCPRGYERSVAFRGILDFPMQ